MHVLWLYWGDFGATRTCLGAILGVGAILGGLGGYLGPPWGWIIKHGKHIPFGEHCWSMRLLILLIKPMVFQWFWNGTVHRTLKSHTFWKCQNRSRSAPVQWNRSSLRRPVQTCQSAPSENVCKTCVKSIILMISRGRLAPIGGTKFEAKCPRQDPFSHGYKS